MAMLAENFVENDDIVRMERIYKDEEENGRLTLATQFQYSCCLVQSRYKDDIHKGIDILSKLCQGDYDTRDFTFFLALGYYKLGEFTTASKYIQRLLTIEPRNSQAIELKKLIDAKLNQDTALGIALTGGLVALGGVLIGMLFAKKSK